MAQAIGKKITKGLLQQHLASIEPQDPLYEETIDARGKKKRTRRQLPPGLSDRDQKILLSVKKRAHYLDKGISLCGFRVGWTFFIGLIPGLGDAVDAILNYCLVLKKAKKADLPDWLLAQMLFNNMVSLGVSLIPLAGDIVMGVWKANSRNAHLLEEFLALRGQENIQNGLFVPPPQNPGRTWWGGKKTASLADAGGSPSDTTAITNAGPSSSKGVAGAGDGNVILPGPGGPPKGGYGATGSTRV